MHDQSNNIQPIIQKQKVTNPMDETTLEYIQSLSVRTCNQQLYRTCLRWLQIPQGDPAKLLWLLPKGMFTPFLFKTSYLKGNLESLSDSYDQEMGAAAVSDDYSSIERLPDKDFHIFCRVACLVSCA